MMVWLGRMVHPGRAGAGAADGDADGAGTAGLLQLCAAGVGSWVKRGEGGGGIVPPTGTCIAALFREIQSLAANDCLSNS